MTAPDSEAEEHHRRGFQLLTQSSYAESRAAFIKAIEKRPQSAAPYLGLGQTFFFQKKPDLAEALKAFHRVVELRPDWVEGHHWLGTAQERNGALKEAVQSYQRAIHIAPSDTRPLMALGSCLIKLNRCREAVRHLRRAVELKPHYGEASAHLWLADALMGSGQKQAACDEWNLVLSLPAAYPEHESAHEEAAARLKEHCGSVSKRIRKR